MFYRPVNIHFVQFAVRAGGAQVGIYDGPMVIPPEAEILAERWHHYQSPLDPLPPIHRRTFYHFSNSKPHDHVRTGNAAFDLMFYDRLPKKLNSSILTAQSTDGNFGWGIHIIEGPNKSIIAWLVAAVITISFVVAVMYDIIRDNADSGFAIGQWLVAALSAVLTGLYFHLEDIA